MANFLYLDFKFFRNEIRNKKFKVSFFFNQFKIILEILYNDNW